MSVHKLQRNAALFEAVANGVPLEEAAGRACIVKERARQIVHATCESMLDPARLRGMIPPPRAHATLADFRRNAPFWLAQLWLWKYEHKLD